MLHSLGYWKSLPADCTNAELGLLRLCITTAPHEQQQPPLSPPPRAARAPSRLPELRPHAPMPAAARCSLSQLRSRRDAFGPSTAGQNGSGGPRAPQSHARQASTPGSNSPATPPPSPRAGLGAAAARRDGRMALPAGREARRRGGT